jgi:hypothetical protein
MIITVAIIAETNGPNKDWASILNNQRLIDKMKTS